LRWLDPSWEPAHDWPLSDRVEVVSAFHELIERDVYRGNYSLPGRPNFTSVSAVLWESAAVLEHARASALELLRTAREERKA
jgi:hypothetical protein